MDSFTSVSPRANCDGALGTLHAALAACLLVLACPSHKLGLIPEARRTDPGCPDFHGAIPGKKSSFSHHLHPDIPGPSLLTHSGIN